MSEQAVMALILGLVLGFLAGSHWASRVVKASAVRSAVYLEATTGFEPVNRGFADLRATHQPSSPTVAHDGPPYSKEGQAT